MASGANKSNIPAFTDPLKLHKGNNDSFPQTNRDGRLSESSSSLPEEGKATEEQGKVLSLVLIMTLTLIFIM